MTDADLTPPRRDGLAGTLAAPPTRAAEWRAHWPLVLAAFVGISLPIVPYNALGLFIEPLSKEFGWSRTLIAAGGSMAAAVTIPLAPFFGALVDRWGARRLALPGLILTGLMIAAFSLANGSAVQWLALWGVYALVGLLLKSTLWTAAVSGVFTAGRSLALSCTLSGMALAAIGAPPVARWLIDAYGWREAWRYLAVGWTLPAFVLCVFFLFDVHDRRRRPATATTGEAPELEGLSIRQALRSLPLYRIALATLLTLLFSSSLIIHKVPLLTEAGVSRETAALLASLAGVAGVVGGLTTGWLMQRFDAGWVAGITNALMALALVFLLEPFRTPTLIVAAMLVVGYAGGTKVQICAYLTSVYAGMKNYGKIFGVMGSIIAVTGAIGPLFGGIMYDVAGSYTLLIWSGIPASLLAGALLIRLGPFPDWARAMTTRRGPRNRGTTRSAAAKSLDATP